ncbi:Uncharacterised protein g5818 [Pycnogonum litorale]
MSSDDWKPKPYKVWSSDRMLRRAIMVSSYVELIARGKDKLGIPPSTEIIVVLEADGTEIDDDRYFKTVRENTVLMFLKRGEKWYPPGIEAIRAAITAFPKIVCEAINSLELLDKQPSWKIMDNKGRVTVVLHWDQRELRKTQEDHGKVWTVEFVSKDSKTVAEGNATVSSEKGANHVCDFHCTSLHTEVPEDKMAATSLSVPESVTLSAAASAGAITESSTATSSKISSSTGAIKKAPALAKSHVRFLDDTKLSDEAIITPSTAAAAEESESDTETATNEDDLLTERYLLLVDQLSLEQNKHLSIKDIGIILERLSSKIVDVDRLERETESSDVYNWTIKATIKGEVLREIGVIYKGQYYGIMEHPGYF